MSLLDADEGLKKLEALAAARDALGCTNPHAFMHLSFMSLSVIPELKLTAAERTELVLKVGKRKFLRIILS